MDSSDEQLLKNQLIAQRIAQGFRNYLLQNFVQGTSENEGEYVSETKDGVTTITFSLMPGHQVVPFEKISFQMDFTHR